MMPASQVEFMTGYRGLLGHALPRLRIAGMKEGALPQNEAVLPEPAQGVFLFQAGVPSLRLVRARALVTFPSFVEPCRYHEGRQSSLPAAVVPRSNTASLPPRAAIAELWYQLVPNPYADWPPLASDAGHSLALAGPAHAYTILPFYFASF